MNVKRSGKLEGSYTSSSRANRSAEADILRRLSDPEYKEGFGAELAKVDLAVALALARHAAGLTQAALADMIGAKQSYVAKLEGGEANPTIGTVGRILARMDRRLGVFTRPLVGEAYAVYWDASSLGYVPPSAAQSYSALRIVPRGIVTVASVIGGWPAPTAEEGHLVVDPTGIPQEPFTRPRTPVEVA